MQFIPVRTSILQPPQDDLFQALDRHLSDVRERDVVLGSSKVVAIHEGRCVRRSEVGKEELVLREADYLIRAPYRETPLTIKHHTFLGAAGIDESNGNGYYVLLPEDVFASAERMHTYLKKRFGLREVGVVITDSRSQPLRFGATGVALAFWGIVPLTDHVGKRDIFGREIQFERSNIVDGLAAGACVVSGEVAECQPVVIARQVPGLAFKEGNLEHLLMVDPAEDMFRVLYEDSIS